MDLTKTITTTLFTALLSGATMIGSAAAAVESPPWSLGRVTHSDVTSNTMPRIGEGDMFYRSSDLTATTHRAVMAKHQEHKMSSADVTDPRKTDLESTTHN